MSGMDPKTLEVRQRLMAEAGAEIRPLLRLSLRHRLGDLALWLALWAAAGTLAIWGVEGATAWNAAALLAGVFGAAVAINALNLLMHEGMHGVLFAGRRANRAGSVFLGATVLMGFSAYRVMHLRHHRHLGTPLDPDDYHNYARRKGLVWLMHFLRLTVGCAVYVVAIPILALRFGTPVDRRAVALDYAAVAVLYAAVAWLVPFGALVAAWLAPLTLVAVMVQVRGFTQHGIARAEDPLLASRCIQPNRLVAALVLHENHHLEHHIFPEVPSYNLRRLHAVMWPRLPRAVTVRSYGGFVAQFLRQSLRLDETPIGLTRPSGERP